MAEESNEVKPVGPCSPQSPQSANLNRKSSSPRSPKQPRRVKLTEQQLDNFSKDELVAMWHEQELYVEYLEAQTSAQEGEISSLKDSEEKYRQQYVEATHREKILVRRLASKEQELQEYINQISEMKAANAPSIAALRSALLDPAVNMLIQKLRQELVTTKAKLEDTQNELSAWKFTPDSNTGKRLMAKCRLLYQENEELGRMIASGRIAKLEGELALQKSFSEEVKKSQSELDEFLQDLDEDVEGMQSTIYFLQQELRKARESVLLLQQENSTLKNNVSDNNLTNGLSPHTPPIRKEDSEDNAVPEEKLVKIGECDVYKETKASPLTSQNSPTSNEQTDDEKTQPEESAKLKPMDNDDDSSSDSTALSIKVENEELSDREEEKEESRSNSKRTLRVRNKVADETNGDEVQSKTTRTKREKSGADSDEDRTQMKRRRESPLVILNGENIQLVLE